MTQWHDHTLTWWQQWQPGKWDWGWGLHQPLLADSTNPGKRPSSCHHPNHDYEDFDEDDNVDDSNMTSPGTGLDSCPDPSCLWLPKLFFIAVCYLHLSSCNIVSIALAETCSYNWPGSAVKVLPRSAKPRYATCMTRGIWCSNISKPNINQCVKGTWSDGWLSAMDNLKYWIYIYLGLYSQKLRYTFER